MLRIVILRKYCVTLQVNSGFLMRSWTTIALLCECIAAVFFARARLIIHIKTKNKRWPDILCPSFNNNIRAAIHDRHHAIHNMTSIEKGIYFRLTFRILHIYAFLVRLKQARSTWYKSRRCVIDNCADWFINYRTIDILLYAFSQLSRTIFRRSWSTSGSLLNEPG